MTVDIRAAAEAESDRRYPEIPFAPENEALAETFVAGAVWAQAQLTPTREQIAEVLGEDRYYDPDQISNLERADAVLAIMQAS